MTQHPAAQTHAVFGAFGRPALAALLALAAAVPALAQPLAPTRARVVDVEAGELVVSDGPVVLDRLRYGADPP